MPGKHRQHRLVEPLGTIDDDQQSRFVSQTPSDQVSQEATTGALVLRRRLHEAQGDLLSVESDAQSDDDLFVGEALAVEEERHQIMLFQAALLEFGQLPCRGFHVPTGHRRGGQTEALRHGFGTGLVVPCGDALQHPHQQTLVHLPRRL